MEFAFDHRKFHENFEISRYFETFNETLTLLNNFICPIAVA